MITFALPRRPRRRQREDQSLQARKQRASRALIAFNKMGAATPQQLRGRYDNESSQETWDRLRREEIEAAARDFDNRTGRTELLKEMQLLNRTIGDVWKSPLDKLHKLFDQDVSILIDVYSDLPVRETPVTEIEHERVEKVASSLPDILPAMGIHLNDAGYQRLLLYVASQAQAEGGEFIAADSSNAWIAAIARLTALNAWGVGEYSKAQEPEPRDLTEREQVEQEYQHMMSDAYRQWESDMRSRFGVTMTDSLLRIACERMEQMNLSPLLYESWEEVRRKLHNAGIIRAQNQDEALAERIERGEIQNPYQFNREAMKLNFGLNIGGSQ